MKTNKMEELLGLGKFDTERKIPGTRAVEERKFCYVSNKNHEDFNEFFDTLLDQVSPPIPEYGGAMVNGCKLTLPDGEVFEAMSYKGDIEGWRLQIEQGAKALNAKLAWIDADSIVLEDNQSFSLTDCKVDFY